MHDLDFGSERKRHGAFDSHVFPHQQRTGEESERKREQLESNSKVVGILVSGGLDSSILLKYLLDEGRRVKPLYVQSGLCWQVAEKLALDCYLDAVNVSGLEPLTVLDLPLADLYGDHWSITGQKTPDADTPDEAVFMPGRNALLTIKTALWCQMHDIGALSIATLKSNPFEDASDSFFERLEQLFNAMGPRIKLWRPFARLNKQQVMEIGRDFPLERTFCCIAPQAGLHCGKCNKCAERQAAFRQIHCSDPTHYAQNAMAATSTW
jgi:7-cyano-7-deazaguanine synthase